MRLRRSSGTAVTDEADAAQTEEFSTAGVGEDEDATTSAIAYSATGESPTMQLPAHESGVDDYYGSESFDEVSGVVDEGQVRPPVVGGTTGGAGTTTVAEVIGGIDLGRLEVGAGCDVLVARSNVRSLKRAAELLGQFPESAGRPVLVVVPDGPGKMPSAVTAWVRILKGQTSSLVLVEWVPQMRMLDDPAVAVAQALDRPKPAKWARQYYALLQTARTLAEYRLVPNWDPATDVAR